MKQRPIRLVVIVGSTRVQRCAKTISSWFVGQAARRPDVAIDVVDLAEPGIAAALAPPSGDVARDDVRLLSSRLRAADAFVVVTPEYNHSYPASLKNAIDWFHAEWHAKPVGFVSYGGVSGGLRAVEPLRNVFAELHAATVRNAVSFANFWDAFGDGGRLSHPARFERAADRLLDQLVWWADALRTARDARPYVG